MAGGGRISGTQYYGCVRDSDVEFLCARFQYYRYFR